MSGSDSDFVPTSDEESVAESELLSLSTQPPILTPLCFSVNQINVLQNLGLNAIAASYESDDAIQRVKALIRNPEKGKINKLPSPWKEEFRSFSLDTNGFMYMDERLVIPQTHTRPACGYTARSTSIVSLCLTNRRQQQQP